MLNEQASDYSSLQGMPWHAQLNTQGFLTAKNSLFSKHSNSVVTQEDQFLQDIKTNESIGLVRQLMRPPQNFGRN